MEGSAGFRGKKKRIRTDEMYRDRGGVSKTEIRSLDRKRINDTLDKHLERSSPSTSKVTLGTSSKDRDRLSVPSTSAGKLSDQRPKNKCSGMCYYSRWS